MKMTICTTATDAPVGVESRSAARSPVKDPTTEITAEQITTDRKLRKTRMADRAGKMMREEMRSAPTSFMASTMTTPLMAAIRKL